MHLPHWKPPKKKRIRFNLKQMAVMIWPRLSLSSLEIQFRKFGGVCKALKAELVRRSSTDLSSSYKYQIMKYLLYLALWNLVISLMFLRPVWAAMVQIAGAAEDTTPLVTMHCQCLIKREKLRKYCSWQQQLANKVGFNDFQWLPIIHWPGDMMGSS